MDLLPERPAGIEEACLNRKTSRVPCKSSRVSSPFQILTFPDGQSRNKPIDPCRVEGSTLDVGMESLPQRPEDSMRCLVFFSLLCSAVSVGFADSLEVTLNEGDAVPMFEAKAVDGTVWRSEDHVGQKFVVVYFYPADLTSGCTLQACGFRDMMKELEEAGVEIVGVSGDSVENHQLFAKVNSLNFPLLADEEGKISKVFGVPVRDGATITRMVDGVERSLRRGITASRWTFLIDAEGRVVHKNTTVDAEQDCKNILETVRRLTAQAE